MSEKEFTVSRKTWLRGEGSSDSYLYRLRDGRQCCLGFYLESSGVARDVLEDQGEPDAHMDNVPEWLLDKSDDLVCKIIQINDKIINLTDKEREVELTKLFAQAGVKINFVD